jgi:hypothetical protein
MSDPNRAPVTQDDRDAAGNLWKHSGTPSASDVRDGKADGHYLVQALALHRLAALNGERDAIVRWLRKEMKRTLRYSPAARGAFNIAADAIESGDHLRGRGSD